jgi:acyl-[acyl-carrier-protein]-phospholipid O-acyltransferase/long-chain-fatty-acid--[acyl-carrier-protein] ligase
MPETAAQTEKTASASASASAAATVAPEEKTAAAPQRRSWAGRQFNKALKAIFRTGFRLFYGNTISGQENLKGLKNEPLLIVANHTSFLDGLLLASSLPVEPAFAIDTGMYERLTKNRLVKFFMDRIDFYPMDTTRPQAIRELSRLAQNGKPVMIFPEGRLTTTGTLMQVFDGAATVADTAKAKILPVYMNGLNFLPFGATRLKNYPKKLFPRLSVTIMKPTALDLPDDVTGKARRKMRHDQLEKIMHDLPVNALDAQRSLIDALHDAARNFGRKYEILDDAEGDALKYGQVLTGAYALGGKLAKETAKGENVGFLLPNSKGAAIAFWGLQAYGRVPTMLNAKAENADMMSYTQTASLKTVVTSRRFVEMAKLEDKIEALSEKCKIVYLEDVKKKIGFFAKIKAVMQSRGRWPRPKDRPKGGDPAVVIFTSGSEGPPKGVVLSGSNLLSNVEQVHAVTPYTPHDRVFNAMPIFHSFGLTGGMVMPMVKGLRSFQYPTPLDGKIIPKLVYFYDTTIMFGTDTFLNLYARNASDKDLVPLRMVFAGAERLSDETYDTYVERFGVRPNQAYGLSEASPGVAINVPGAHKRGTVGRFLPGIETRLEPVADMENGFRLSIKGPNIMMGYLKHDNPGVIQAPPDGWHDTGDIISISDDGYVKLTGRAKRFAKIGGEMVSLDAVENVANAASLKKDVANATVLKQDAEKGDSIVLFTTDPALKREQLAKAAQETGRSILGIPKNPDIHVLEAMPRLPTGKTDYVSLKKMLAAPFNEAASPNAAAQTPPSAAATPAGKPAADKKQAPGA